MKAGRSLFHRGKMRGMKRWLFFAAFVIAIAIEHRLRPDPLVEVDHAAQW